MAICSRNLSLCCAVLSGWGILQLIIMGVLFYNKAIAFAEDLEIEIKTNDTRTLAEFYEEADTKYNQTANNCWVAAGIYIITFLISLQQFYSSRK